MILETICHLHKKNRRNRRNRSDTATVGYGQKADDTSLDRLDELQAILRTDRRGIAWECNLADGQIKVEFQGDETDCSDLLNELICAQVPVVEFRRDRESLEQIFLKMGHQQAS
jgi:ABC-2 type transport system ATP-binding protein